MWKKWLKEIWLAITVWFGAWHGPPCPECGCRRYWAEPHNPLHPDEAPRIPLWYDYTCTTCGRVHSKATRQVHTEAAKKVAAAIRANSDSLPRAVADLLPAKVLRDTYDVYRYACNDCGNTRRDERNSFTCPKCRGRMLQYAGHFPPGSTYKVGDDGRGYVYVTPEGKRAASNWIKPKKE